MSGEPYQYYPGWNALMYPAASRAAWQCPGCKTWHAPHADKCECQKALKPSAPEAKP
jgi:hypothetical protein